MKIHYVTNGNYIDGYYLEEKNAEKAAKETNLLIEKFKDNPNVDKKKVWVSYLETMD